jgi:hypothetical protein
MSKAQNLAPGVEIVLFKRSLVVVRLAVWVKAIAAGTILDAVSFRLGGADAGLLLAVSDLAAFGGTGFWDEENGVGAGNGVLRQAVGANTLSKTAKVIGHAGEPQGTVGSLNEETTVHGLSSGGMND